MSSGMINDCRVIRLGIALMGECGVRESESAEEDRAS